MTGRPSQQLLVNIFEHLWQWNKRRPLLIPRWSCAQVTARNPGIYKKYINIPVQTPRPDCDTEPRLFSGQP